MKVIVFKQIDNSLAVMIPTAEALQRFDIDMIARRDVPADLPYLIIEDSELPTTPQETWEYNGEWTNKGSKSTDWNVVSAEINRDNTYKAYLVELPTIQPLIEEVEAKIISLNSEIEIVNNSIASYPNERDEDQEVEYASLLTSKESLQLQYDFEVSYKESLILRKEHIIDFMALYEVEVLNDNN